MADTRREYSYDDLFPERWLHAPDLDGRTVTLGITDLYAETITNPKTRKQDECGIVSFYRTKREYVLSKQNAWILKTIFGPTKADVVGKRITISPVPDTSGFTEHGIRILFVGSPDIDKDRKLTLPGGTSLTFKKTKTNHSDGVEEGSVDAITGEVAESTEPDNELDQHMAAAENVTPLRPDPATDAQLAEIEQLRKDTGIYDAEFASLIDEFGDYAAPQYGLNEESAGFAIEALCEKAATQ